MIWAGYAARLEEARNVSRFLLGNLNKLDHFGDLGIGGRIMLKSYFSEVEFY
jgi:hypothetical protein